MVEQTRLETLEREGGNTKTPSLRVNQLKRWCFTFNNYVAVDFLKILETMERLETDYIIGEEVGEEGTPHLQGYIELKKAARWSEFNLSKNIHWEAAKGNREQNITYCSKDGKYKTNMKVKKPLKVLKEEQLRDWQLEIIEIIKNEPDDRKIYWYWEPVGNVGKTTFSKYLSHKYGAIPVEGKKNDILYCAAEYESDIYIFDFERSMEEYISYGGIEKIKNGYYMCSKYESKPIIRNPPHIIIFANFEPDKKSLSGDRWVIVRIL